MKSVLRCAMFEFSESMVDFIQVSVRQTRSGWWELMRSQRAAEWSGWETDRILKNVESEVGRTRIWFSVATEKKQYKKKRITRAQSVWARRNEEEQRGCAVQM